MKIEHVANVSGWEDNSYTATIDGEEVVFFFNDRCCEDDWVCGKCGKKCDTNENFEHNRTIYATHENDLLFVCSECLDSNSRTTKTETKKFWRAETHEYGEVTDDDFPYRDNVEDAIDDAKNALGSLSAKELERETACVLEWEEVQEGVFETTGNVRDVLTSLEKPNG